MFWKRIIIPSTLAGLAILIGHTGWSQTEPGPPDPASLPGLHTEQVLEVLGLPDHVSTGRDELFLAYRDEHGIQYDMAVVLHTGVVVMVHPDIERFAARIPLPTERIYPGQSVADAVQLLGPAISVSVGPYSAYTYADGRELRLRQGRVIGIERE